MLYICGLRIGMATVVTSGVTLLILKTYTLNISLGFQLEQNSMIIFVVGLIILIVAFVMNYIVQLQQRVRQQMSEYFNLINRMREGVLVLIRNQGEAKDTDIKFFNKSFLKIFDALKREDTEIRVSDLKKPRFFASKLLKENLI